MLRSRNRRGLVGALAMAPVAHVVRADSRSVLRIGTTPVFLDEQVGLLDQWRGYLSDSIGREVQFTQRRSYREITEMLLRDELEAAWVCGFPYVMTRPRVNLCVTPIYHGKPRYQAYLIVPSSDTRTTRIEELRGTVFAFSDPESNSGYLVPFAELARDGVDPGQFFKRSFFTFGHRKVVEAVASGLAQGGSVDGYVWDTMQLQMPASVARARVAWRSPEHGFPPIVVRATLETSLARRLREALVSMDYHERGRALLTRLNLDRFEPGVPDNYASIEQLVRTSGVARA